jgi:transcriptional regulator of acetoin/glycerol metabolism
MGLERKMKSIWKSYVTGRINDDEIGNRIRPEILESWKRCRDNKANPFLKSCPVLLSPAELAKMISENSDLLDVAQPVIDYIYEFVAGTGFVVMICDRDGYILRSVGDPEILASMALARFVEGSSCSEAVLGTNSMGTCIIMDKPIQVTGYEHWTLCTHIGTCSAAPIHDPVGGAVIGCLNLTGPWDKVHPHTLGMVVAGVGAIESLLESQINYRKAVLADQNKSLIMESTSDGLITIDNNGLITHANGWATKFLALDQNPTGGDVHTIFKSSPEREKSYGDFLRLVESKEKITDESIVIQIPSGLFRYMGSAYCIQENGETIGRLIVLQDISRVNRLVTKVIGKQARTSFADLRSQNEFFQGCVETALSSAKTNANILLLGESGTGKELFARAIHNASLRSNKPFIAINCGAIPRDLLSSELFGYAGGAFTGAHKSGAPGKFELADGGTIFLDEIGDMPLEMQAALLRVIEEKSIMRVGSGKRIPTDVRIIAATNKDLHKEVENCNFRFDLYYRLNVICITLPPLRERKEDIPTLISKLIDSVVADLGKVVEKVEPGFIEHCMHYDWPGNIRELRNVIERAISLTTGLALSVRDLPSHLSASLKPVEESGRGGQKVLRRSSRDAERLVIKKHLEECMDNRSMVAEKLGVSRSTLYRKLKELDLMNS